MKKLIIAIVIVVICVAGWAGATYIVGGQVESRYSALLDQYGQYGGWQWSSQSYERGFLTSRARTVLELPMPKAVEQNQDVPQEPLRLTFEHILHHGPLPAGNTPDGKFSMTPILAWVETRLVDVSPSDESLDETVKKLPQLRESYAFTVVGLDGGGASRLMIPAFEQTLKQDDGEFTFSWDGLTVNSQFSKDMEAISGECSLPRIQVRMKDGGMAWDGIHANFDLTQAFPMVYVGDFAMHLGGMQMNFQDPQGNNEREVSMKGLDFTSQSVREGSTVRYDQAIKLAAFTVGDETYGPGLMEVTTSNLDGEAVSRFQSDIQQMSQAGAIYTPEDITARLLPVYIQFLTDLAKSSPEIDFRRVQFATPRGNLDGSVRVKLHGEDGVVFNDPQSWAKNLEAAAQLTIDEGLVRSMMASDLEKDFKLAREQGNLPDFSDEEIGNLIQQQIDGQIEAMAAQNLLLRENGQLKSQATFNRGELVVNERALPLFQ